MLAQPCAAGMAPDISAAPVSMVDMFLGQNDGPCDRVDGGRPATSLCWFRPRCGPMNSGRERRGRGGQPAASGQAGLPRGARPAGPRAAGWLRTSDGGLASPCSGGRARRAGAPTRLHLGRRHNSEQAASVPLRRAGVRHCRVRPTPDEPSGIWLPRACRRGRVRGCTLNALPATAHAVATHCDPSQAGPRAPVTCALALAIWSPAPRAPPGSCLKHPPARWTLGHPASDETHSHPDPAWGRRMPAGSQGAWPRPGILGFRRSASQPHAGPAACR